MAAAAASERDDDRRLFITDQVSLAILRANKMCECCLCEIILCEYITYMAVKDVCGMWRIKCAKDIYIQDLRRIAKNFQYLLTNRHIIHGI